ncbi:hypothetical protein FB384_004896 [Prauserella sediminis]|uniref:ERF superfamily protein n=1 Tax=Prauserella sediminis TaxID=577680 RepID=A0A839XT83_9PSEU|nr:ERF family protein [Prauserella sediminis]MBB3665937.1 hypothetical protein [Prauserella sediminis]
MSIAYDTPPTTSDNNVHAALMAVMQDVRAVGKDGFNGQSGYNFRGIDGVVNAVGPALRRHGVMVRPELLHYESEQVEVGKNRTLSQFVTVQVRYTFTGPAGDETSAVVPGSAMDTGDKAVAKAMSVAFRICLLQALTLPTEEPDPDETTYERSPAAPAVNIDWTSDLEAMRGNVDGLLMLHRHAKAAGADEATLGEIVEAGKAARAASQQRAQQDVVAEQPQPGGQELCEGSGESPESSFAISPRGSVEYGMCPSCMAYIPLDGGTVLAQHVRQDAAAAEGVR